MTPNWSTYIQTDEYKSLSPQQRAQASELFFQQVVAPNIPESEREQARAAWQSATAPTPSTYQNRFYDQGAETEPVINEPGLMGDTARSVGAGFVGGINSMVKGAEWLADRATEGEVPRISPVLDRAADHLREGRSQATNDAVGNFAIVGDGDFSLRGLGQSVAEGAGSLPALALGGGPIGAGTRVGLRAAGVGEKAARTAGAMTGYSAAGSLMGGSGSLDEVQQEVLNADLSILAEAPAFREEYQKLYQQNPEGDHAEMMTQAREMLAVRMGDEAFGGGAARGAVLYGMLGPAYERLFRGVGGALQSVKRGAGTEFVQEGADQAISQAQTNMALTDIDGRPVSQNVLARGVDSGIIGAISGGVIGGVTGGVRGNTTAGQVDPEIERELNDALNRLNTGQATKQDEALLLEHQNIIYGEPTAESIKARETTERSLTGQFGQPRNTGLDGEVIPSQPISPIAPPQQAIDGESYEVRPIAQDARPGLPEPDGVIYGNEPDWMAQSRADSEDRIARARNITKQALTGQFTPSSAAIDEAPQQVAAPLGLPQLGLTPTPDSIMMADAEGRTADPVLGPIPGDRAFTARSTTQPMIDNPAPQRQREEVLSALADAMASVDQMRSEQVRPSVKGSPGIQTRVKVGDHYEPATFMLIDLADNPTVRPQIKKAENQNRDRTRAAYQQQVQAIANNLDFNELGASARMSEGAPTVTKEGVIIGGNGRVSAILEAYRNETATQYREELERRAGEFGVDASNIRSMKQPALVRRFDRDVDVAMATMRSNEQTGARMSPLEQARIDGDLIQGIPNLNVTDDGKINTPDNFNFFRQFVSALPVNERNDLVKGSGALSQSGLNRIQNALMYKAYGDTDVLAQLIEGADDGGKNIHAALLRAAPHVASVRSAIDRGELHDLDVSAEIVQAVALYNDMGNRGQSINDYLAQGDMVGGISAVAKSIAQVFDAKKRSAKSMAEFIIDYYDRVQALGSPDQAGLFGDANPTVQDYLNQSAESIGVILNGQEANPAGTRQDRATETGDAGSITENSSRERETGPIPEIELTAQTEQDAANTEAANAAFLLSEEKARKAAEQRRKADSEALDFRLSGSSAAADVAAAGGQVDLLGTQNQSLMDDDADLVSATRANIAGRDQDEAALIILRDMLEIGTDIMNDTVLPNAVIEDAAALSDRITDVIDDGGDIAALQREAVDQLAEWESAHDLGEYASEIRAIRQQIESQAGIEGNAKEAIDDAESPQQDIRLKSDGTPFKTERSAKISKAFRDNKDNAEVVPVDDGFGVRVGEQQATKVDAAKESDPSDSIPEVSTMEQLEALPTYGIYKQTRKLDGAVRYFVRGTGTRGMGDTIHTTIADAQEMAQSERRRAEGKQEAQKEQEAAKQAEAKAKAEREADTVNGFTDGMTPLQAGRAKASLSKEARINGEETTYRAYIDGLNEKGELSTSIQQEPKIKPMSRRAFNNASQRQQDDHARRMAEAGNKSVYYVNDIDLGKTAYDYANHLLEKTDTQAEPAQATEQAEPAQEASAQPETATAPIEDAGEKLGGARKDILRTVRERLDSLDDEAIASATVSKLWPKTELEKIKDPLSAALYHAIRDEIPNKPQKGFRLQRWVDSVKSARDLVRMVESERGDKILERMRSGSPELKSFSRKVELLMLVDRTQWSRIGSVRKYSGEYRDDKGNMVPGEWLEVKIDDRRYTFYGKSEPSEIGAGVNDTLNSEQDAKQMKFEIRGSKDYYFINKTGDSERRPLVTFDSLSDARKYKQDQYNDLVAAWEAVKQRDNITKSDMRSKENKSRIGIDHRDGQDITPEQFLDAFGFRGVEFGNWVGQGKGGRERQGMLNAAYDAFMDLATALSLPPKALSLGSRLGIGFGSRGTGRAAAHYESDAQIINLTKTKGAGSLAHEWFHALDNYFSLKRGTPKRTSDQKAWREQAYITYRPEPVMVYKDSLGTRYERRRAKQELARERAWLAERFDNDPKRLKAFDEKWVVDPKHPDGVRPLVEKTFAELVATLDASPMAQRSKTIDKGRADGYWSQVVERAARAFETHIIARLADQGHRNDFLANVTAFERFHKNPDRYPYLKPDEQGPVSEAFDRLFETIETMVEDDGSVTMFSRDGKNKRSSKSNSSMTREAVQSMVDDIQAEWPGGINVVQSITDLPLDAQRNMESSGAGIVRGMYRPKDRSIWLIADNLTSRKDAEEILMHELVGHAGLRALLGKDLESFLNTLYDTGVIKDAQLAPIAENYGLNLKKAEDRLMALEEYIAHTAQYGNERPTLMRRVIARIRNILRQLGFATNWTDDDLRVLIDKHRSLEVEQILDAADMAVQVMNKKAAKKTESIGEVDASPDLYSAAGEVKSAFGRIFNRSKEDPFKVNAIGSHVSEFARLRGFWDSASDVLRRLPAFKDLAGKVDQFYDQTRQRLGDLNKIMDPVQRKIRKLNNKEQKQVHAEFRDYMAARENGRKAEAEKMLSDGHGLTRELVDAWQKVADLTGEQNQSAGVRVFDPKEKTWRLIGKLKTFWPRAMNEDVMKAMHNPSRHTETWKRMAQELFNAGRIEQNTIEAADDYLSRELGSDFSEKSRDDYFAGIEKARTAALPEFFYDYSYDAAVNYMNDWAENISRIEAFGQASVEPDAFMEATKLTRDQRTKDYIMRVRDRVYNTRENNPYVSIMGILNGIATGIMLGNPATATLNLIGGTALNFQAYGMIPGIKATASTLANLSHEIKSARELGILIDDYTSVLNDMDKYGAGRILQTTTSNLMKYGGYTPMETFIRTHGFVMGRQMLRKALGSWRQKIDSAESLRYLAWYQRNGFDTNKLIAENGSGPETNRLFRYQVNLTQGSYKVNQTPVFVDSPIGRFLFKYQKFGTQLSRMFWINHLKPFIKSVAEGGETVTYTKGGKEYSARVRTFLPMLRFFGVAILAGATLATVREAVFGYNNPAPDLDELEKALENDDTARALTLAVSKAWNSMMAVGALGFFGNYLQMVRDVADRQRVKSPIDPPGLSPIKGIAEMALRSAEQGGLTARDWNEFAEGQLSLYRTARRATLTSLQFTDFDAAQLEQARRDRTYTRTIIRRYANEIGLENKRRAPDRYGKTEMSNTNQRVIDALLLGDSQRAAAIVADHVSGMQTRGEIESALTSVKAAVRSAMPTRVSLSPSQRERTDFLAWAEHNLSERGFDRIKELDDAYHHAAVAAGLMARQDNPSTIAQQRRQLAQRGIEVSDPLSYLRRQGVRVVQ